MPASRTIASTPYKNDQGAVVKPHPGLPTLADADPSAVIDVLARAGFVILRGFAPDLEAFSRFVREFSSKVTLDPARTFHGGDVAQKVDAGTAALGLHIENGNSPFVPDLTWFLCERAASAGSQTTVCDGATVWRAAVDTELRRFADDDITYSRRVDEVKWKAFVAHHLDAPKAVDDITVDDIVALANDGDATEITLNDDGSIEYAYRTRAAHPSLFGQDLVWANSILGPSYNYEQPRITDSSGELGDTVLALIAEVTERCTVEIDWVDGDVALIDNTRVMHGRREIVDPDLNSNFCLGVYQN